MLGITSSAGRGGGGGRGGGRGGYGAESPFSVNSANGISKTNALGLNYSNKLSKKVLVTGSYFYNNSTNTNDAFINTQTFTSPKNQFTEQGTTTISKSANNRINARLEYTIDSNNVLYIIPNLSFQNNNSISNNILKSYYGIGDSINTYTGQNTADRSGYNLRNEVVYRHNFGKKGRTISFGIENGWTKNDGAFINNGIFRFFQTNSTIDSTQNQFSDNATSGTNTKFDVNYVEPIGKKGQLQFNVSPSVQKNKADQQTFTFDGQKYSQFDTTLSNKFDNTIKTNSGGLTYRLNSNKDDQIAVGLNVQRTTLESQRTFPTKGSVNQSFSNLLPNALFRKKLSNYSNVRIFYRAYTNLPSINQLQDVVNLSDPIRVSSGNPDVQQANGHFVGSRYAYTNTKTNKSFFANFFFQTTKDYITNATYIAQADSIIQQGIKLRRGSQLTKPVNLDGYRNLRGFLTYSMPLKFIKTNLNVSTGVTYAKLPGLINNKLTNTDNYTYSGGVVLASNISQFIDFNLNYNTNINRAKTTGGTTVNNNFENQAIGAQINLLTKSGWFLQNDVTNQKFSGLTGDLNQNFTLWNAALGKKFLKNQMGELKLSVFDLLKQNQSITRIVTGNYVEDSRTQVLQQYFLMTFTYNLKNFGTKPAAAQNNVGGWRGGN